MPQIIRLPLFDGKYCNRCNRTLPYECFYPAKDRPDGFRPWCKECKKIYDQSRRPVWFENGRARVQNDGGKFCPGCRTWRPLSDYGTNAGSQWGIQGYCQECRHKYYQDKNDIILEQHKRKYWLNPEKARQLKRNDHYRHKDERNAKRSRYRVRYTEREKARINQWFRDHPERVRWHAKNNTHRRRMLKKGGKIRLNDWSAMCKWFGNICLSCGADAPLTIDHVIPLSRGGTHAIENAQPLCKTCNRKKFTKTTDYRDPDRLAEFLQSIGH